MPPEGTSLLASTPTVPASISLGIVLVAFLIVGAVFAGLTAGTVLPTRALLLAGYGVPCSWVSSRC